MLIPCSNNLSSKLTGEIPAPTSGFRRQEVVESIDLQRDSETKKSQNQSIDLQQDSISKTRSRSVNRRLWLWCCCAGVLHFYFDSFGWKRSGEILVVGDATEVCCIFVFFKFQWLSHFVDIGNRECYVGTLDSCSNHPLSTLHHHTTSPHSSSPSSTNLHEQPQDTSANHSHSNHSPRSDICSTQGSARLYSVFFYTGCTISGWLTDGTNMQIQEPTRFTLSVSYRKSWLFDRNLKRQSQITPKIQAGWLRLRCVRNSQGLTKPKVRNLKLPSWLCWL